MSYTLCVIDMQAQFSASNGAKVQRSCVREIKKAMKDNATIVFVEFEGYGPTLPLLTNLVKDAKYKKVHRVLKNTNGGGKEVAEYLRAKHLARSNIRVVGVNTSYCVLATVQGMNVHLNTSNLNIVANGCSCHGSSSHKYGLEQMRKMERVKILREKK